MQWNQYKDTNCYTDNANRLMKADKPEQLIEPLRLSCFFNGFEFPDYECIGYSRALYEDPFNVDKVTGNKKAVVCMEFKNMRGDTTVISEKLVKKFIQKTSKFYVGRFDAPVLIVNKNYCVVAAPAVVDSRLNGISRK